MDGTYMSKPQQLGFHLGAQASPPEPPVLHEHVASMGEVALGSPGVKGGIIPLPPDKELKVLFACISVKQKAVNFKLLILNNQHSLGGRL